MPVAYLRSNSVRDRWNAAVTVGTGTLLGFTIAQSKWLFSAALAFMMFLFLWPVETALGGYAFLVPFDSVNVIGGSETGTSLTWIAGTGALVTLILTGLAYDRLQTPPRAALWWAGFIIWSAASILWAVNPQQVIRRLPTALSLFLLYLVVVCIQVRRRELSRIAMMVIAGGCVASAYASFTFIQGGMADRTSLELGSNNADPNQFAASLLLPLSLAVGEFFSSSTKGLRYLMLAATALISLGMLLTMSRGAFIAVMVMTAVYFRHLRFTWRMLIPVAVLGCALATMPQTFFSRFEESFSTGGAGRIYIWQAGVASLQQYAGAGAGLENFEEAYQSYAGWAKRFRGFQRGAHNIYLAIAVELGIYGLLLAFLAIRSHLHSVRELRVAFSGNPIPMRVVASYAACLGLLTAGFFLDILWRKSFWLAWIFLALTVREARQSRRYA